MFIGAENIISPLGNSAKETFERMKNGESSINNKDGLFLSSFSPIQNELLPLIIDSISDSLSFVNQTVLLESKTLLIVSTTKGEINSINSDINKTHLSYLSEKIKIFFSCSCTSKQKQTNKTRKPKVWCVCPYVCTCRL